MMMIASYFQAIGDAKRSALLSLARTYLFAIPLTFVLPLALGENGIWLAGPIANAMLLLVTTAILARYSRGMAWGRFKPARPALKFNDDALATRGVVTSGLLLTGLA